MMSPTPIQTQLSISPTSSLTHQVGGLLNAFKGGNGLMLLIVLVGWFLLARFGNHHKKNRLATARFAGVAEKRAAKRKAMGLIKARKHNEVAFKIYKSLDLPYAERGIAVSGGAGSGKTASMILPIAYSAIEQGFPLYTYDFKYLEPNDSLVSAIAGAIAFEGKSLWAWLTGFFALGMAQISYNIIVGLAAVVVVNADVTDTLGFLVIISILAPALALALAAGGGMAVFHVISSGVAGIATTLAGGSPRLALWRDKHLFG